MSNLRIRKPVITNDLISHDVIDVHHEVKITPSNFNRDTRTITRNIFNSNSESIKSCDFSRGVRNNQHGSAFKHIDPDKVGVPKTGYKKYSKVLYLGWLWPHFGHFLMESTSRCWAMSDIQDDFDALYFDIYRLPDSYLKKGYVSSILNSLGIDENKVVVGNVHISAEELVVPSQSIVLHNSVSMLAQSKTWNSLRDLSSDSDYNVVNDKVYLSRSKLINNKRSLSNELELESRLQSLGFRILHTEEYSITEVATVLRDCSIMIGLSGSAIHNSLFMNPAGKVISIISSDFELKNELLGCIPAKLDYYTYLSVGDSKRATEWNIDVNDFLYELETIL